MTISSNDSQVGAGQIPDYNFAADTRALLLCIALFLVAAAATVPVVEMGLYDDWAYTHMVREFASSGHISYNGWPTAIMLPQILWAGALVKLFGFSFLVVRLSTLILATLLAPVLYFLGRESGLARPFAVFVTLLSTLSPVCLPLSVSFMSDIPGYFLFALCLYGSVRSWKASTPKSCIAWAGLVAFAGVLSGLDRQVYWEAPLLFLPAVAWVQRRKKGVLVGLGLLWVLATLAVGWSVLWFQAKPYILVENLLVRWKHARLAALASGELAFMANIGLTAALVLLPLFVGYCLPGIRALPRKPWSLALAAAWLAVFAVSIRHNHVLPRMGNVLTEYGIQPPGLVAIGARPMILGPAIRDVLTFAVFFSCSACAVVLWKPQGNTNREDDLTRQPTFVLGLLFATVWLLALLYRSPFEPAFDRYLITFIPLIAIPLLRYYQLHIGPRVSRLSWAVLVLFALYGVATTHDKFAVSRARLAAVRALEESGVPPTAIMAGFEYDGWTQIETVGHVNDGRIKNPVGAYRPVKCIGPESVRLWYLRETPAIHARYFIALSPSPDLEVSAAAPVEYTAWLPPGRRSVFTEVLPQGGYAGCQ